MKLEAWEREPLWLKLLTPTLKKKRFPRLEGTPEIGRWVRLYADGCLTANGEEVEEDETYKRKRIARILSIIPAIGAIVLFILWIIWLIVRRSRKRGRNAVSGTQVKHAGR